MIKMEQLKNNRWVISRRKYIFFKDYWCPEWQGWVSRAHYLYNKCQLDYKDALKIYNMINLLT